LTITPTNETPFCTSSFGHERHVRKETDGDDRQTKTETDRDKNACSPGNANLLGEQRRVVAERIQVALDTHSAHLPVLVQQSLVLVAVLQDVSETLRSFRSVHFKRGVV
jgi:hypothetical protein